MPDDGKQKPQPVPVEVLCSDFGCPNCLYHLVECKNGSKYVATAPFVDHKKQPHQTCGSYAYYD